MNQAKSRRAIAWAGALVPITVALALAAYLAGEPKAGLTIILIAGLLIFGFVSVVNSSIYSYLSSPSDWRNVSSATWASTTWLMRRGA
jgi:hypothetical protein